MPETKGVQVFDFDGYKSFLDAWFAAQPHRGRGMRSKMAEAIPCQPAYLSQVLKGEAHFSPEQGEAAARFLSLSGKELEFFMLLLQRDRAGTANLRAFYQQAIHAVQKQRLILKERLEPKNELSPEDRARYYSAWHFAAIHMLVTIPEFRSEIAIVKRLKLSRKKVADALEFLAKSGLIRDENGTYLPGISQIHLGHDDPNILKHHTNWRVRAIESFEDEEITDVHYSSVMSIARSDMVKIKEAIVKSIEQVRKMAKDSAEEEVCAYSLDFFRL